MSLKRPLQFRDRQQMLEEAELYDLERQQEIAQLRTEHDEQLQVGSNPKSKPSLLSLPATQL